MTTGKLYAILTFLEKLEQELEIQSTLNSIATSLTNLTNSPAQPQYQSALGNELGALEGSAPQLREKITPSLAAEIKALGGEEFFDFSIAEKVKNQVQINAMTPAVARDYVKKLTSERAGFLQTVRNTILNLENLNLDQSLLKPGAADLAFLIPRDIFDNQIGPLAKELIFINRLVEHVSEAITGEAEPAVLEQLSSSDPTIAVFANTAVILAIGKIVNEFLDAWKKIEEIRAMRAKLSDMGLKGTALEELSAHVTNTVDEVVEHSTQVILENYPGESGRKAELINALKSDARRLFGQIERGLKVEINVNRSDGKASQANDKQMLEELNVLATNLEFPEPAKHPMVLETGKILEGDISSVSYSTKTTAHRKTVSKKIRVKSSDGAAGSTAE
jgi:hypothetical protein